MKLLEDNKSAEVGRAPHTRTKLTLSLASVVLVVGIVVGLILINTGGTSDGGDAAARIDADATFDTWIAGVSDTCSDMVQEHPVLTDGEEARMLPGNVEAVDAGVSALVAGIRDVPRPADDAEQITSVLALAEETEQAWAGHSAAADEVTSDDLTGASDMTGQLVTTLVDLEAADCSALN